MAIFPLRIRVQIAPGADLTADPGTWTWVDITSYTRARIEISRGRPDEASQTPPAQCRLRVRNTSGAFVTRNPAGPWYPNLRRNTPLRVQVDIGSGYVDRFTGHIDELPIRWSDGTIDPYVDVVASGVLRRLGQGSAPLRSPLYRAISKTSPLAYWPLEDGPSSTQAASGLLGGSPLTAVYGEIRFGEAPSQVGSAPLADFSAGGTIVGSVPPSSSSSWRCEFVARFPFHTGLIGSVVLDLIQGGTWTTYELLVDDAADGGAFLQESTDSGPGPLSDSYDAVDLHDGQWHHYRWDATQSGTSVITTVTLDGVQIISQTLTSTTLGAITQGIVNPTGDPGEGVPALGHLAVWAPVYAGSVDTLAASRGYAGEGAADRMIRVCAEESVPFTASSAGGLAMGPQPVASLLAILRDAEATDGGVLYETTGGKLAYLARENHYGRTVRMALTYGQLAAVEPTDDDQRTRNDITAVRSGGSSARITDVAHIAANGRYDEQITINPQVDAALADQAGWRVRLGTVDELRYPTLTLNLADAGNAYLATQWLGCDVGSRITISNPPPELAVSLIDLIVEGYREVLDAVEWRVELHCSPASPWSVATVDGEPRVAADGSTLGTGGLTATGTSFLLASTTSNGPWTTDVAAFPLPVRVGGEQVTLSAITGSTSPQTATVSARGVNGVSRAWPAGTEVDVWYPAIVAL